MKVGVRKEPANFFGFETHLAKGHNPLKSNVTNSTRFCLRGRAVKENRQEYAPAKICRLLYSHGFIHPRWLAGFLHLY